MNHRTCDEQHAKTSTIMFIVGLWVAISAVLLGGYFLVHATATGSVVYVYEHVAAVVFGCATMFAWLLFLSASLFWDEFGRTRIPRD